MHVYTHTHIKTSTEWMGHLPTNLNLLQSSVPGLLTSLSLMSEEHPHTVLDSLPNSRPFPHESSTINIFISPHTGCQIASLERCTNNYPVNGQLEMFTF